MAPNYSLLINKRTREMRPSPTFDVKKKVDARTAEGKKTVSFSVGEPAEPTADYIVRQLGALLSETDEAKYKKTLATISKYGAPQGIPELRTTISHKLTDENELTYDPKTEIMVGNGGKQAIFEAIASTLQPGDAILIPEPSWVSYPDMAKSFGVEKDGIIGLKTNKEFKVTPDALRNQLLGDEEGKIKWIVLNSPSNPTGATYTQGELHDLSEIILAENRMREEVGKGPLMVLSDDIYEHMVYDDRYVNKPGDPSAVSYNIVMANPEMKPYTLIINGVAKAFSMTGWHVGYAAGPKEIIEAMSTNITNDSSGISAIAQLGANIALSRENKGEREKIFIKQREAYKKRLGLVEELINGDQKSSIFFQPAPAAFYAMLDCTELCKHLPEPTAEEKKKKTPPVNRLANLLVDKYGVALVPGDDFFIKPDEQDRRYLRMSFATDETTIAKGIEIIKQCEHDLVPEPARIKPAMRLAA